MWRGIFALFFRSLRSDARSIGVFLTWMFLLFVIYGSMISAHVQSAFRGAPGLLFFSYVIYTNAIFISLLGISYFSSVITEEKEEDTLGLMTMAGISPIGILLGKSTTRLFQVLLLLAVQYPFTLLAITLGGLVPNQIYAAYLAEFAFTILLANMGLFCSVICRRNRDAAAMTTLMMISYIFGPLFALAGYEFLKNGPGSNDPRWIVLAPFLMPPLEWISRTSIFGELYQVTETGDPLALTPQLISNTLGGIALFFLSWLLFGLISQEPAAESTARALVPRRTGRLWLFSAGRAWDAALAWKDFHFISGGWFGLLMRCGLYIGLYWLSYVACYPWYDPSGSVMVRWHDVTWGFQFFVVPLFTVDCALIASRLFQEEIRYQTLSALLMLPRSVPHIVYSKLAGCLFALAPGLIALIVAFTALSESKSALVEMIDEPAAWWFLANLFLVVHLSALFSLYLRWGAFAMSLAVTIGGMTVTVVLIEMMMFTMGFGGMHHDTVFGLMVLPIVLICVACHLVTLLRLPALGEK